MWSDSTYAVRQLPNIGEALGEKLVAGNIVRADERARAHSVHACAARVTSIEALSKLDAARIEAIVARRYA
jgi:hypothetical protein